MQDREQTASPDSASDSDSAPESEEASVSVKVGLNLEFSPWQRREFNQLLIALSRGDRGLPHALETAMPAVCEAMGWSVAFCRWSDGTHTETAWHSVEPASAELENLKAALERAPVAGWEGEVEGPLIRLEPLIRLPESRAREAARDAGFAGYALLPVIAAGKPVALLELLATTAPPRAGGLTRPTEIRDCLEVLAWTLGLVATGQRMRAAVGKAAAHAKRCMAEVAEARRESEAASKAEPHGEVRTVREDDEPQVAAPEVGQDRTEAVAEPLYDERTGLPMRAILLDRMRQAIRRRQRSPRDQFAVIVAEVLGLERVEERGGPQAAEDILVAAGRRLSNHTRPADSTGTHGAGRFVVIVEGIRALDEALAVANRVEKELRRPFPTARTDVRLDVRIGLVLGGPAYDDPEALLADAGAAAIRAGQSSERIQVFDRASEDNHQQRERLKADLASALERKEFYLEYQPIVSLQDGRITGLETFLRWRHPELGLVPPDRFIPVAAESPLIHDLGLWVMEQVCEQINRWRAQLSVSIPPVGINVTGRQLFHESFLNRVREILERQGIQGRQVRFDVAEGELMRDANKAAAVLDRLQGMGIDVAIDDFGTGYSSLSLLHDLPVRALKIDRSFISHRREKLRKWGVARTIVELARILEVEVIAEGIETREQFLALRQAGCTQAQGYHFSGPVGTEEAQELIREGYPLDLEAPRH